MAHTPARSLQLRRRKCLRCGKTFLAANPALRRKYCSYTCAGRSRSKLTSGDLRRLKAQLKTLRSYPEIARDFHVTRQYVHYLASRWGMTPRPRLSAAMRDPALI
jgi:hypothetical protein